MKTVKPEHEWRFLFRRKNKIYLYVQNLATLRLCGEENLETAESQSRKEKNK
jgi:hypothetical protein